MIELEYVGVGIAASIVWLAGMLYARWNKLNKGNFNQKPLAIHTFDDKESPYHPSVLFFEEEWQGHRYYMAETPFSDTYPIRGKNYRDQFECPSIHVSDDGLHWSEICENPIDRLERENLLSLDYFSDPHLVYKADAIECWYRISRRHGDYENHNDVSIIRKVTVDGKQWSERETLAILTDEHPLGNMVISPAVLYRENTYQMWYVDSIDGQRHIAYSTSPDGFCWSKKTNCLLTGRDINPWHMDVSFIDSVYRLIIYDRIDLSLWSSIDGKTFCYVKSLLLHSDVIGSFYYRELYRACLIKADNLYRLYFSANDMRTTSIGVMEGTTPEELKLISVDDSQNCHFHGFVFLYTYMKYKSLLFLKKRLCIMVKQTGRIKAGK